MKIAQLFLVTLAVGLVVAFGRTDVSVGPGAYPGCPFQSLTTNFCGTITCTVSNGTLSIITEP